MPTISKESKLLTLINIFTVEPAEQRELVDLLIRATETSVRHVTGFVSATLHRSLDGTKVAMYASGAATRITKRCAETRLPHPTRPSPRARQVRAGMYEVVEIFTPAAA